MANRQLSASARLLIGLLACSSTLAVAQTYRWVDPATGRTMFTDTPPPGAAKEVKKTATSAPGETAEMSYATRMAAQNFPVTLYTGADCPPCGQAREHLSKRGVPFTEKSVQTEADLAELKALVNDASIPSLKVGRQTVKGFEAGAYDGALDLAGYPKSGKASGGEGAAR